MANRTLYELRSENLRKTYLFLIVFSLILFLIGYFFVGSITGLIILAAIIFLYTWIAYKKSDKIALASVNAIPADPSKYYVLHNVVEEVSIAAGIPKPKVYIMKEAQPNAFATGKDQNHAAICVTTGLLSITNREELQGVVSHEIAHIRNRDILLMTVVGIVAGLIILARDVMFRMVRSMFWRIRRRRGGDEIIKIMIFFIIGLVLSSIVSLIVVLIRAAISRQREFLADATGAYIIRDPEALASALEKIGNYTKPMRLASEATAHMFISNPFGNVKKLFATHPPIEERIKRLRAL